MVIVGSDKGIPMLVVRPWGRVQPLLEERLDGLSVARYVVVVFIVVVPLLSSFPSDLFLFTSFQRLRIVLSSPPR
jgi:flagellar biosynthesis protein FliP